MTNHIRSAHLLSALFFSIILFASNASALEGKVIYVTDGDTLRIRINGVAERVRLIGIDAPESHPNEKALKRTRGKDAALQKMLARGKESADYLKHLVKSGDIVQVETDVRPRDDYGRILAYVYLPGHKMLNEKIVRDGYANLETIPPDTKYASVFKEAYADARKNHRGLWGE